MKRINVSFILHAGKYIICRVSYKGTMASFSTGIQTSPENWSRGRIISRKKEELEKADQMAEIIVGLKSIDVKAGYTAKTIVDKFLNRSVVSKIPITVIEMIDYTIESKSKDPDISDSTVKYYEQAGKKIKQWIDSKKASDINIHDLNPADMQNFYSWMRNENGLVFSTAKTYVDAINGAIDYCIRNFVNSEDMIRSNPVKYAVSYNRNERADQKRKTLNNHLTVDQVKALKTVRLDGKTYLHKIPHDWYRMTALWQIFTGFSYADLCHDDWTITSNMDGDKFIVSYRTKTRTECSIPLMSHTEELLEDLKRMRDSQGAERLFPVPYLGNIDSKEKKLAYNQSYKVYSRVIKEVIEPVVGKKVTSHTFRHTFGMLGLNYFGYSVEAIAKMMGHRTIKTTLENYAERTIDGMKVSKKAI